MNSNPSIPAGSCHGFYDRASNSIVLYNDAVSAVVGAVTPGAAGTIQNSQCAINGGASPVFSSGTDVVLNLNITRQGAYSTGSLNLYAWVTDNSNLGTGCFQAATWSVGGGAQAPTLAGATPGSSASATQTITLTGRDGNGYTDINRIYFLVNNSTAIPAGTCHGFFDRAANGFFLYNDALSAVSGRHAAEQPMPDKWRFVDRIRSRDRPDSESQYNEAGRVCDGHEEPLHLGHG